MLALIYASAYTEYTVSPCETVEEAERVCMDRFGMRNPRFGQTDAGILYTVAYGDEGIIVLSLQEIESTG
jgi:hypothetical protein